MEDERKGELSDWKRESRELKSTEMRQEKANLGKTGKKLLKQLGPSELLEQLELLELLLRRQRSTLGCLRTHDSRRPRRKQRLFWSSSFPPSSWVSGPVVSCDSYEFCESCERVKELKRWELQFALSAGEP
uniref:Uncharacterized protein n=1 Tax=Palpitomonas bilix TaxID=652834 RepID=A0A7S3LX88_9EUKA